MRILFAGNPAIAVPTLSTLLEKGYEVVGVLVNADAPQGRGRVLVPSPVKQFALSRALPIFEPQKLTAAVEQEIAQLEADMMVCFAYGKIFKSSFLSLFRFGAINIHPSLLPLYRGPTPIQAALLAGDRESGISVQRMALQMDAGAIIVQERFMLDSFTNSAQVSEYVALKSGELVVKALDYLNKDMSCGVAQDEQLATYCQMIDNQAGRLDLTLHTAQEIYNRVRAFTYEPGAFCYYKDKRLTISKVTFQLTSVREQQVGYVLAFDKRKGLQVQALDGFLWIEELQLAGKKRMDATSFFNGNRDIIGQVLV